MNKKIIILITVCFSFLLSCNESDQDIFASGTFEAREFIISSKLNGEIKKLKKREGDHVEEGQILGQIEAIQLALQKEKLLSTIRSVEARQPDIKVQLAPLSQQIKTARQEEQRIANLLKVGAATEKNYDDMHAQLLSLETQYRALESSLKKSNDGVLEDLKTLDIELELIDNQIQDSIITSPINGRVLALYAEQGEYTMPGKAILKIANLDDMILRAYVTSAQLSKLKLGQSVAVLADFSENDIKYYDGTISWISDKSEFTPKTVQTRDERSNLVYAVKVIVENDGFLKIGMYGAMKISNE